MLVQCFEDDTPHNHLEESKNSQTNPIFKPCWTIFAQNLTTRASTADIDSNKSLAPVPAGWFLIPSTLLPHPLSWRTEAPEQNLWQLLQARSVPLMPTRDNRAQQSGTGELSSTTLTLPSFPRRNSRHGTHLEHVLFRNISGLSFPFATCPFPAFFKFIIY